MNAFFRDYTLATTSPLVDAAHPLPLLGGWLTSGEVSRWQNERLDIGAAELPVNGPPELSVLPLAEGSSLRLKIGGFPGRRYRVEHSDDFATWTPFDDLVTYNGSAVTSWEPADERRFFRAVSVGY